MIFQFVGLFMLVFASKAHAKSDIKPILIDGSSTLYPLTEAVVEEFNKKFPAIRVSVGSSGTGGGFSKFLKEEIQICDASRPISSKELEEAKVNKVEFIVLPVAYDALSVVVSTKNKFIDTISIADLKKIWEPGSKIFKWSDLNPNFPKKDFKLFAPGAGSGTFDYFTKEVVGKEKSSRKDFEASENDDVLVRGIAGNEFGFGYFGHSYVEMNKKKVRALKLDAGAGAIEPSNENIRNKKYPLSRVLYIYINKKFLERKEVADFVDFYLASVVNLSVPLGFLNLESQAQNTSVKRFKDRTVGL